MTETRDEKRRGNWLWEALRGKKRSELDEIERSLIMGRHEKREYAGDPNQDRRYQVRTRNK